MTMEAPVVVRDADLTAGQEPRFVLQDELERNLMPAVFVMFVVGGGHIVVPARPEFVVGPSQTVTPVWLDAPWGIRYAEGFSSAPARAQGDSLYSLIEQVQSGRIRVPDDLMEATEGALTRLDERRATDIHLWAIRLAEDVADATD